MILTDKADEEGLKKLRAALEQPNIDRTARIQRRSGQPQIAPSATPQPEVPTQIANSAFGAAMSDLPED